MNGWTCIGAALAGLAVVIGAFGAHGIDDLMVKRYQDAEPSVVAGLEVPTSWKRLEDFKTGADYQMYHALGLIAVGLLASAKPTRWTTIAGWSFLAGILLFSGSLYALSLTGQTKFGMVAPLGGMFFIVGWIALAIGARSPGNESDSP